LPDSPLSAFDWLTRRPIAHRGLHDGNKTIAENSMAAFRAAMEAGFAIECDIHIAADGVPVVFHDGDLARMAGMETEVSSLGSAELGAIKLAGTQDGIPTLAALLELVAGRVPLVVEMKGTSAAADTGFVQALTPTIEAYDGPLALMSFDDWLLADALPLRRKVPLGLTAEGTRDEKLAAHRAIVERGCDFVSYNVHHLPNPFVEWVRQELHLPVISWTVRTPDDVERSHTYVDQMTFEGFLPR
jgi:glycerophosphoryl diester phosphodiesterase